jgi:hypothetical protein
MADIVVLLVFVVFAAVCVAYVRWCDRVIGPDGDAVTDERQTEPEHAEVPS